MKVTDFKKSIKTYNIRLVGNLYEKEEKKKKKKKQI